MKRAKFGFTLAEGATHIAMQHNTRKLAFTLAEGATHVAIQHNNRKLAFTLAEVLVTLAVIGIVAVMTIPNLVQTYQSKAWNTADTVFQRKLTEALKIMNTQGTLAGYGSTEAFVNELSKHLKITKTCTNSNLTACFDDKISMRKKVVEIDINKVKTSADLGQSDWGTNVVGFQLASGVTGLMAYNPKCTQDQYSNQITGGDCLAVLYDVQGYTKPNFVSKDIRSNGNVSRVADKVFCDVEFADQCWTISGTYSPMTFSECTGGSGTAKTETSAGEEAQKLGIQNCYYESDYWAGAVKQCGGTENMPKPAQLAQLATQIFGQEVGERETNRNLTIADQTLYDTLHSKLSNATWAYFYVWSGEVYSSRGAYGRYFYATQSIYDSDDYGRDDSRTLAVCLSD